MGRDCVTSDLAPRLAWGVGHRNVVQRRLRCVAFASGVHSSGKLSFLHCLDNNSLKPFFQVLLLNFITKLEKNQLDMMNVTPSAGYSWGASWAYKDTTK